MHSSRPVSAPSPAGRRRFIGALAAAAAAGSIPLRGHAHGVGAVNPPLALPATGKLMRHDGQQATLQEILAGKVTAMQLMFTGCSQTCPLQGALFAEVQDKLRASRAAGVQLLSLSIDPFDDRKALAGWLRKFGAGSQWIAALPSPRELDQITAALQQGGKTKELHSTQVYFFNRRSQLIWRSEQFPPPQVVTRILDTVVAL